VQESGGTLTGLVLGPTGSGPISGPGRNRNATQGDCAAASGFRFIDGKHTAAFNPKETTTLWQVESGFFDAVATIKDIFPGSVWIGPDDKWLHAVRANNFFHRSHVWNHVGNYSGFGLTERTPITLKLLSMAARLETRSDQQG
jgi:hypothetical protein